MKNYKFRGFELEKKDDESLQEFCDKEQRSISNALRYIVSEFLRNYFSK